MPAISDEKNREHVRNSKQRRARAYLLVKAMAQRAGYMDNQRDTAGLDRFMDDFEIRGVEIDWFESMTELLPSD